MTGARTVVKMDVRQDARMAVWTDVRKDVRMDARTGVLMHAQLDVWVDVIQHVPVVAPEIADIPVKTVVIPGVETAHGLPP